MLLLKWLLVFLVLVIITTRRSEATEKIVNVTINNELDADLELTLHCKSKDDDLGIQKLPFNGSFGFHFRPNFWFTTLYFCSFQWKDAFHRFDIYIADRDYNKCKTNCMWNVIVKGPCMFNNNTKLFDVCYDWKPEYSLSNGVHE